MAYDPAGPLWVVMRGTLTGQHGNVDDILRPHVGPSSKMVVPQGTSFSKIMLVRIQRVNQDFLRHFSAYSSTVASPLPRFVPCRAGVGSAKTVDAIVSLCTHDFRVGC
ncbi:hypothetical protein TNCV_3780661 [Trichonephila clavipes]|nr:hypothetical protein TNCV_3780661 [Trichonephila clavipes]